MKSGLFDASGVLRFIILLTFQIALICTITHCKYYCYCIIPNIRVTSLNNIALFLISLWKSMVMLWFNDRYVATVN